MSHKTTHLLVSTAVAFTLTSFLAAPAMAADASSGLFLRGAESLGDLSKPTLTVPLEAANPGAGCNTGDGAESVQCGILSDASGSSATALGANTIASGVGGTAIGNNADAVGSLSTAIGVHARTDGIGSNAIGLRANASGNFSNALGRNANASGTGTTAIGLDSEASGDYAQAFGRNANASGPASLAIGVNSQAAAPDSVAIGNRASANFANSVAIGNDSIATRTNQIVLGSATTTYTLAGITSAASRGQQGAVVGILTTDANGNLASDGGALQASVADHELRITGLESSITEGLQDTSDSMAIRVATLTPDSVPPTRPTTPPETPTTSPIPGTGITPDTVPPTRPTTPTSPTTSPIPGTTLTPDSVPSGGAATQQSIASAPNSFVTPVQTARSVAEPLPAAFYGSNLNTAPQQGPENAGDIAINAENIATNAQNLALTSQRVDVNSERIAANASSISENAQRIALAFGSIEDNTASIAQNTQEISELNSGLAAVTALPDMYLSPDAKWSASGGVGIYGDDVGIGATLAIRAGQNLAFGASVSSGGDKAAGRLQVRYEGF